MTPDLFEQGARRADQHHNVCLARTRRSPVCSAAAAASPRRATTAASLLPGGRERELDGFRAINKLSLDKFPVSCAASSGPNGAGKTTMMDIITGAAQ
jgi:ABC-type transport system involved in cytochrome bd biosynthesis fused ATPase/permease subunit